MSATGLRPWSRVEPPTDEEMDRIMSLVDEKTREELRRIRARREVTEQCPR